MLKSKNFSYLLLGRLMSNLGSSVYSIVIVWSIVQTTNSSLWIGIYYFSLYLPGIFSFLFGNIIDKTSKRKLLIFLEVGSLLGTSLLAFFISLDLYFPLILCTLAFIVANFDNHTYAVQDAYTQLTVEKKDLEKASSYQYMTYQIGGYLFNAIIGFAMLYIGQIYIVLFSVFAYGISVMFFINLEDKKVLKNDDEKTIINEDNVFSGFIYIFQNKLLLLLMITGALINFFFSGLGVYLVLIANGHNSSFIFGIINTSIPFGGLIGSVILAKWLFKNIPLGKKHVISYFLFGIGLLFIGFFTTTLIIIIPLVIAGLFLGVSHVTSTPIMQSLIPEKDFGKIMSSIYTITVGVMPLGALAFGVLANRINSSVFFTIFGAIYIIVACLYRANSRLWNLSLQKD